MGYAIAVLSCLLQGFLLLMMTAQFTLSSTVTLMSLKDHPIFTFKLIYDARLSICCPDCPYAPCELFLFLFILLFRIKEGLDCYCISCHMHFGLCYQEVGDA